MLPEQKTRIQDFSLSSGIPLNSAGQLLAAKMLWRMNQTQYAACKKEYTVRQRKKTHRFLSSLVNTLPYKSALSES